MRSKKLGKITSKTETRISSPFDTTTHKTERSGVAVLMHWMREIIEKNNIDLGLPDVETGGSDTKFPDVVIYKTKRSQDVLCTMEFKPPYFDLFNETELKEPAWRKANKRHSKYFVTSNFHDLILWDTEKVNAQKPEAEQIVNKYHLSDIYDLKFLEDIRYRKPTISSLEKFLNELYEFSTGKKIEPRMAIDEILIFHLQDRIRRLAYYYQSIIYDQAHKDSKFTKSLAKWFNDQGWSFFIENDDDYYKAARQTAYLLANKILFYNALQLKRSDKLDPLRIPEDLTKGGMLQKQLQSYFDQVVKEIDYETIYDTDFIDQIAFPESREVVEEIKGFIDILKRYDFSTLGYDVIGRIFERLIPEQERHSLGQYFTNSDVVDLILKFCLKHEDDKLLDPSCGAGTFLVRAYQHKKIMNQMLSHKKILNDLWGNDIAKFPAHLATINLAINDLSVEKNYPNIMQKDFFDLVATPKGFELPESVKKVKLKQLGKEEKEIIYPRSFDCLVGNPPYTRQEEISEISDEKSYKENLISKALFYGNNKIANISKRAGVYAYFFIHGIKFLKNKGRFGFIVSNAWLDVEYGAGLQEFFLKNYKIIAIIESKVERWFEDADINTSIIILEKASGQEFKKERDENLVRFVYLFKPLRYFIPPSKNIWAQEIERLNAIDKFIKTILAHSEFYQNDDLRIYPKKQFELWEEGLNEEKQKYIGTKWGKYIRAPEIFFKILEKAKDKLVPLNKLAKVGVGFVSGANNFFYLNKERINQMKIENKYLRSVIKSPKESNFLKIEVEKLKNKVLLIDPKDKIDRNLWRYIKWGESQVFHKRPTCASHKPHWYNLYQEPTKILASYMFWLRHGIFYNPELVYTDRENIRIKPLANGKVLWGILNSTFSILLREIDGRVSLGEGSLKLEVMDWKSIKIVDFTKISNKTNQKIEKAVTILAKRPVGEIFDEIGSTSLVEISSNKVKSDRRNLDKIVMGEILGLSDEEQLEIYRAVIDLVKSRIEKAKSFGKKKKTKDGVDIDALVNIVLEKIGENTLKKFYKEKILSQQDLITKKLPELRDKIEIKKGLFGWQLILGKNYLECHSETEARYLKVWLEVSARSIKIPKDNKYLTQITKELESRKLEIDNIIESYLGTILDQKLKSQILHQIWQKIV